MRVNVYLERLTKSVHSILKVSLDVEIDCTKITPVRKRKLQVLRKVKKTVDKEFAGWAVIDVVSVGVD